MDHKIPVTEALFLPHFPLRGEIEDHDFEVKLKTSLVLFVWTDFVDLFQYHIVINLINSGVAYLQ